LIFESLEKTESCFFKLFAWHLFISEK